MPETKNVSGEYKLRVNGTTCLHVTPNGINGTIGATTPAAITGTTVTANTQFTGPTLASPAPVLSLQTAGGQQFRLANVTSPPDTYEVFGGSGTVTFRAQGGTANISTEITPKGTGIVTSAAALRILTGTAIPAGGTAGAGFRFSSTSNFGIFFGSGAPSLAAAQGSLYLRSDGSSTSTRLYVNTDGSTTWTNVTTAA